jgi:hypothetical protein
MRNHFHLLMERRQPGRGHALVFERLYQCLDRRHRLAFAQAEAIFALHGAQNRLILMTPDAPHDFPETERQAAYAWLDALLKGSIPIDF